MPQKSSMRMDGLRELQASMKDLSSKTQRQILRRATAAGAQVMVREVRARAPVLKEPHPNRKPGTIKKNIRYANVRGNKLGVHEVMVGVRVARGGKGGPDDPFYWRFVEFGTAHMAAQPFLRPAFETKKVEAANRMKERLTEQIESQARKTGRLIGKVGR